MISSEPELSKGNVPVTVEFKLLTSSVGDTTEEMIKLIIVPRDIRIDTGSLSWTVIWRSAKEIVWSCTFQMHDWQSPFLAKAALVSDYLALVVKIREMSLHMFDMIWKRLENRVDLTMKSNVILGWIWR